MTNPLQRILSIAEAVRLGDNEVSYAQHHRIAEICREAIREPVSTTIHDTTDRHDSSLQLVLELCDALKNVQSIVYIYSQVGSFYDPNTTEILSTQDILNQARAAIARAEAALKETKP